MMKILSHLHADKTAPYNNGGRYFMTVNILLYGIGIRHISQCEDTRQVYTRQCRPERLGSRRKEQTVIAFLIDRTIGSAHLDSFPVGMNGDDL